MIEIMIEIYKDIPEFEGLYQISNFGNVKSLYKNGKERILKPSVSNGYLKVNLHKNNKPTNYKIHQLVARTFLNHITDGWKIVIDHINNNKLDNRLENLQLISSRKNSSKDKIGTSSNYTGVYWNKSCSKWRSQIRINNKNINLGYFEDEIESSRIYQLALDNIDKYNKNNKEFRKFLKTQNYENEKKRMDVSINY